jgi:hypothetical protein
MGVIIVMVDHADFLFIDFAVFHRLNLRTGDPAGCPYVNFN